MKTNSIQRTYPGANVTAFGVSATAALMVVGGAAGASLSQPVQPVRGLGPWGGRRLEGKPAQDCLNGRIFHHQI